MQLRSAHFSFGRGVASGRRESFDGRAAIFVFMQRYQPIIVLTAVRFALGWCWFWLCPVDRDCDLRLSAWLLGGRR